MNVDQERTIWAMFFASIVGMQEHPGMNRENATRKSVPECAEMADEMLQEMRLRVEEGKL